MIGQGVLGECLRDPEVTDILAVGRTPTGVTDPKLREIVRDDLFDLTAVADEFTAYDACLFCLGVSSAGMNEATYRRITYDLTLAVARTMAERRPGMRFLYISGAGTDERGRMMWARVKGATENALLRLDLDAYMFRPGFIQPMDGVKSKTRLYRAMYAVTSPLYPLLRRVGSKFVTSTGVLSRAMIAVAARGTDKRVLESADINAI
jgi:uncharacterized protein YbjT (DUF2867 family)